MNILRHVLPVMTMAALASCGSQPQPEQQAASAPEVCTYSYDPAATTVKWTAFKFTEKTGVSGTFDTIYVDGTQEHGAMLSVFSTATFSIPVSSVNSSDAGRDQKIREHFFGTMAETAHLEGRVMNLELDAATVSVKMNGVSKDVRFGVEIANGGVKLSGTIDLADWNALASADALNEVCKDLHKGADGISVLWPEVKLEISTTLTKTCN